MPLEVHNEYTQSNCILECQQKHALNQMNKTDLCIPWYLPKNDSSAARLCDPWEAREFKTHMDAVPLGHIFFVFLLKVKVAFYKWI